MSSMDPLLAGDPRHGVRVSLEEASLVREELRRRRLCVVATNGCFDLLHPGHLYCLERAKELGDFLWVGVNSDCSVRALKGAGRPVWPESARVALLCALRVVDAVTVFDSLRAEVFLRRVEPDVYVKGGDYDWDRMDPLERRALEELGTKVVFVQRVPGYSTSGLLRQLRGKESSGPQSVKG
jgi:rfaE bifunctional protein nucleotidyltransferase chain/domain